jgi:hypothetical protein
MMKAVPMKGSGTPLSFSNVAINSPTSGSPDSIIYLSSLIIFTDAELFS